MTYASAAAINPANRDRRTQQMRDSEVLAMVQREGGFSVSWLVQNRDHAASLHRLISSGQLSVSGSGWIRCEARDCLTWWQSINRWLGGQG